VTASGPGSGVGAIEPRLAAEFPGLELRWRTLEVLPGPSPPELRRRLRALSDRYTGSRVVAMRTQPIAHAYRAFYRQVGLDPDASRVPSEAVALERLVHGGFRSRDAISDALQIALIETGVPVWALDASLVERATLGIRLSRVGELLGEGEAALPVAEGRLVIADAERLHMVLFGPMADGHGPGRGTKLVVVLAVGVDGVPAIHLEEALWLSAESLGVTHLDPG
jgi:DNA/RNA-binding domain of Phe-tRNA-synthetase-like protein